MPRRKVAMRFIEGRRARAATYARRVKGIEKKAMELARLCGARVAIVCAAGAGAGAKPLEWESEEGVLDSYRALPPEMRAQHTLRDHLEAELDKERAKLVRVQQHGPPALADMGAALGDDMTPAEAQELLETIDASLRATTRRMQALGLPLPADGRLEEQTEADAAMPQLGHDNGLPSIRSNGGGTDVGFQLQMAPPSAAGENGNAGPRLEEFSWDDRFQMHNANVTQPGFGFQMHNASMTQPGFGGFPCTGGDYLGAGQMQAPGYGNARCGCSDLTMCHDNGVLPIGYYYPSVGMGAGGHFMDGTAAPEQSATVSGPAPLGYAMGTMYGDLMSLGSYNGYWRPAQDFQRADANASTSQAAASPQNSTPGTSSSSKAFRYL